MPICVVIESASSWTEKIGLAPVADMPMIVHSLPMPRVILAAFDGAQGLDVFGKGDDGRWRIIRFMTYERP